MCRRSERHTGRGRNGGGSTAQHKTTERPTPRWTGPTRGFWNQFRCFFSGGCDRSDHQNKWDTVTWWLFLTHTEVSCHPYHTQHPKNESEDTSITQLHVEHLNLHCYVEEFESNWYACNVVLVRMSSSTGVSSQGVGRSETLGVVVLPRTQSRC